MPIDDDLEDPNRDEDMDDPNERRPQRLLDSRRQADGELSDSDDEGEDDRRNHESHKDPDMMNREGVGHKFGMNIGIMASQQNPTHGAGPSGHHTMVRVLSTAGEDASMEVDSPSSSGAPEAIAPSAEPSTAAVVAAATPEAAMAVDESKNSEDVKPVIESSPKADPPV
jgi:histone deacetylase 1/2